jgi:hypothetical protein
MLGMSTLSGGSTLWYDLEQHESIQRPHDQPINTCFNCSHVVCVQLVIYFDIKCPHQQRFAAVMHANYTRLPSTGHGLLISNNLCKIGAQKQLLARKAARAQLS